MTTSLPAVPKHTKRSRGHDLETRNVKKPRIARRHTSGPGERNLESSQQTLTQINFVASRLPHSDCDHPEDRKTLTSQTSRHRSAKAKSSTLTQMDFFAKRIESDLSDGGEVLTQLNNEQSLPQYDGGNDARTTPRETRKPKKRVRQREESEEYQPVRTGQKRLRGCGGRRVRAVDTDDGSTGAKTQTAVKANATRRVLRSRIARDPVTPSRSHRIESSQTPESISRQKVAISLPDRVPLMTLSGNAQRSPSRRTEAGKAIPIIDVGAVDQGRRSPGRRSILSHPVENALPRDRLAHDSQPTQWSIQPTSSPKAQSQAAQMSAKATVATQWSVPPTSSPLDQSQTVTKSATAHAAVPQRRQTAPMHTNLPEPSNQDPTDPEDLVLDPDIGDERPQTQGAHAQTASKRSRSARIQVFGSRAGNDTQFVADSDPYDEVPPGADCPHPSDLDTLLSTSSDQQHRFLSPSAATKPSPIPTPRLVNRVYRRDDGFPNSNQIEDETPAQIATSCAARVSSECTTTTQVALNDVLPSPPPIPGANIVGHASQLASVPRPSQISTQAASTQGLDPSSPLASSSFVNAVIEISSCNGQAVVDARATADDHHNAIVVSQCVEEPSSSHVDRSTTDPDRTQTPTQPSRVICRKNAIERAEESPTIMAATTTAEREEMLEVITLSSTQTSPLHQRLKRADLPDSPMGTPSPVRTRTVHRYSPIPGYNNDTQSDFTQGGRIAAAYIHRLRRQGLVPQNYVPPARKSSTQGSINTDHSGSDDDLL